MSSPLIISIECRFTRTDSGRTFIEIVNIFEHRTILSATAPNNFIPATIEAAMPLVKDSILVALNDRK